MSNDPILFTGPVDGPAGLRPPFRAVPVTLAHDWTQPPLGTAIITPIPTGLQAAVCGPVPTNLITLLQEGILHLGAAWVANPDGTDPTLTSIGLVL